ncbi:hypothetical protein SUDANB121_00966 [Nocardiopsis dassonvillei]|uniref:hypothetical protein n=1 Tax=Nocardiopsis dassonvillei TaxID=2014 RepID=UPI003F5742AD
MQHRNAPPIEGYEGMPVGTLQHRIRSLDAEQVRELIGYEEEHAHRTAVLELLRHRLQSLEDGAEPSSGSQDFQPERPGPPSGGSPVGTDTQAPVTNPPPHGVPSQPTKPRGGRRPSG